MQLRILAFGIARDIVGGPEFELSVRQSPTVDDLRETLLDNYPKFGDLASIAIAVNSEYADGNLHVRPEDEIVLIPPVSGG